MNADLHRCNLEEDDDGTLRLCRGDHDRSCSCEWESYVPREKLDDMERDRDRLRAEMARYLPILERLEATEKLWSEATEGTGVATLNGYRKALNP